MKRIGRNGAIGVLAAALLCAAACGQRYGTAVPMEDWTKSDGEKVRGTEISVHQGDTLLYGGGYRNFCLTGEAYAESGGEAARFALRPMRDWNPKSPGQVVTGAL